MLKSICFSLLLILSAFPEGAIGQESGSSKELVQYVRDAKKAGLTDAQIQQNAVKAGWSGASVKDAIDSLRGAPKAGAASPAGTNPKEQAPATRQETPKSATPVLGTQTAPAAPSSGPALEQRATVSVERPFGEAPATHGASASGSAASIERPIQRNVSDEYRIGEGDVIQVSVWGERDASVGSVVVRPDGMITMPLIKDVRIAGLSPAEAEKTIAEPLSKLIKAADVTVIVNQINSKKVFMVGGGIKKEGPIPYTYRMTVMQAISEAGGLTDYAKRKKIYVLRNENGRQFKLPFAYDAVLNGEHMELNIPLLPGDTLVVPNH
jgi:polysaccharide export outer membrane protein